MRRLCLALALLLLATSASAAQKGITSPPWAWEAAGARYGIPPDLLRAISWAESRHNALAVNRNSNGSIDRGHMQINSTWQAHPALAGGWDALFQPEYCTYVGAWVLADCIARYGYGWDAVACYNTGKSIRELERLASKEEKWGKILARALVYVNNVYSALERISHNERQGQN